LQAAIAVYASSRASDGDLDIARPCQGRDWSPSGSALIVAMPPRGPRHLRWRASASRSAAPSAAGVSDTRQETGCSARKICVAFQRTTPHRKSPLRIVVSDMRARRRISWVGMVVAALLAVVGRRMRSDCSRAQAKRRTLIGPGGPSSVNKGPGPKALQTTRQRMPSWGVPTTGIEVAQNAICDGAADRGA